MALAADKRKILKAQDVGHPKPAATIFSKMWYGAGGIITENRIPDAKNEVAFSKGISYNLTTKW
jgi:hypothetical protein